MAKKINTEETPQTDNNNIPAPEAQAVPVPETASENLGTGGETEDRLPAKTAGKGNAGSEETTEPHILSLLKKFRHIRRCTSTRTEEPMRRTRRPPSGARPYSTGILSTTNLKRNHNGTR
ncbi:hypothetical protein NXV12_21215 [Bacteroides thetaiotaomicron]|nr:hypothetical protein [Bacteroides thetaiotaomicron]